MLACAIELVSLSAIRRCPLFGVSAIRGFLKYGMYGKSSWYIAYCPLYGRCPLFGVSTKSGSTVYIFTGKCCFYMTKMCTNITTTASNAQTGRTEPLLAI